MSSEVHLYTCRKTALVDRLERNVRLPTHKRAARPINGARKLSCRVFRLGKDSFDAK